MFIFFSLWLIPLFLIFAFPHCGVSDSFINVVGIDASDGMWPVQSAFVVLFNLHALHPVCCTGSHLLMYMSIALAKRVCMYVAIVHNTQFRPGK